MTTWIKIIINPKTKLPIQEQEAQQFQLFATLAMDNLWFLRNQVIHNSTNPSIEMFITKVSQTFKEHANAWTDKHHQEELITL